MIRLLVAAAAVLLFVARAQAHDETVSASDVVVADRTLIWKVDLGVQGLGKVIDLPATGPALTEADLQTMKPQVAALVQRGLAVTLDGRAVSPEVGAIEPRYEPFVATGKPYISRVALELRYVAADPIERVQAQVRFFSDLTSQHRALLRVRWDGESRQITRLGPSEVTLERGRLNPSSLAVALEFVKWGAHHIFIGYDHIAFLLALLLAVTRFRELVKIVTSFTVAHSITILLAAFDVVRIPSRITEALIAASIVYVAVENLLRRGEENKHRWLLTFGFGLVHGLGFAGVLAERLAEVPGGIVAPVLCFNLGVELGQLAIVAIAFPLLVRLRRAASAPAQVAKQRQVARLGSIPILLLGVLWLGERLMP